MTRTFILNRTRSGVQGTQGQLSEIQNEGKKKFICLTLELPDKNNRTMVSCIPEGWYTVTKHKSPSKGECFHLEDVPNRKHILIHTANFAGDTEKGYYSELNGCIAPCTAHTLHAPAGLINTPEALKHTTKQVMAMGSTGAFLTLKTLTNYKDYEFGDVMFKLRIIDNYKQEK